MDADFVPLHKARFFTKLDLRNVYRSGNKW